MLYHLKQSPIQVVIPGHAVDLIFITPEQVNRYFDSYPPYIKERTDGFVSALKYVLRKKVLRFVKVGNDGTDVWIINNSKRSKISNVEAFQLLNGNWNTIEVITQTELDLIPDTGKELLGWSQE